MTPEQMLADCCRAAVWRYDEARESCCEPGPARPRRWPLEFRDDAHALYRALAEELGHGYADNVVMALTRHADDSPRRLAKRVLELSPADFVAAMWHALPKEMKNEPYL